MPTKSNIATFEKGLFLDGNINFQPEGSYSYAKNLIFKDQFQSRFISNENGTTSETVLGDNIGGTAFIKEENREVVITKAGEILTYNYVTKEKKNIASFAEFGCTMKVRDCEWLNVQVSSKGCDTYVHWSSDFTYYWVNLSELENPQRKATLQAKIQGDCEDCNANCDYFKVFRPKCTGIIHTYPFDKGGSLPAGAYTYSARLFTEDHIPSNFLIPSDAVYIGSENNIVGEEANGAIQVEFKGLDCNYSKIEVAVIYFNGSSYTSKVMPMEYFTGDTFTFTHKQDDIDNIGIDITEILTKHHLNIEGTDLFPYNGVMYYYGIRPYNKYNIQNISESISVNAVVEQYTIQDAEKYQIKTLPFGENIALGIVINHDDGTHSEAGHIPCSGGGAAIQPMFSPTPEGATEDIQAASAGATIDMNTQEFKIERIAKPNTVHNLSDDDLLTDIEEQLVDSYTTEIADLVDYVRPVLPPNSEDPECPDCPDEMNLFSNVKDGHKNADLLDKDIVTTEEIGVKWASILGDYIGKVGKEDLIREFTPTNIKGAALGIIDSIKKRERITIKGRKYTVSKTVTYPGGSPFVLDSLNPNGSKPVRDFQSEASGEPTYPGGNIIYDSATQCAPQSRTYPCIRDCEGNYIYSSHGSPVMHHKLPDETEISHYLSNAIGVPSEATPDADEYGDVYINAMGLKFTGININEEDYYQTTGKKVCKNNPWTICMVKLDADNETILTKGIVIPNYQSTNQGKAYHYQPHAVSSFERVNRYIDTGDQNRMDAGATTADTCCMYSLDQAVLKPFPGSATNLKLVMNLSGIGYRHYLYREGEKADNKTFGRQVDRRGTVSATNLSGQTTSGVDLTVNFAKYVRQDSVAPPPAGGSVPLMNKHGQPCLWIGASVPAINDKSFVGDVLEHKAPITDAQAYYGVLYREMDDQYGSLENLSYMPIIQGSSGSTSGSALCGNRFIAPYSYVKTSWVSDKVGNEFPIGNMVPGKSDRSICDNPNDAINSLVGKYIWTQLPKDGDKSDAKNWAGTHSPGDALTKTWSEANATSASESQYYYPGTLTHMNTFVGESLANPFLRQTSNQIKEQVYPFIKSLYTLHAGSSRWTDAYMSQWGVRNPQPSAAEKMIKALILSLVNLIMPLLKVEDLFSPDGSIDLMGDIASLPIFVAAFFLISKVLFTSDWVDEILGIPKCATDDEGGIQWDIDGFFINNDKGSIVFSTQRDLYKYQALREFQGCCDDATVNDIYPSAKQVNRSNLDAFKFIKPNSVMSISQENGIVKDMFIGLDGGLYAHTTDSIYSIIQPQTRINTNSIFDVIAGSPNPDPQLYMGATPEGFAGILNRNYALDCAAGRFFIDYESDSLYHFTGKNFKELSEIGVRTLFKNYTKYCNPTDCSGEYQGNHYTLGYDPRLDRVLITKNEGDNSWTISYDVQRSVFISFHDYVPDKYFFTREDMYSLKDGELWSHSAKATNNVNYCNYYGNSYNFELDIAHILPGTFAFKSFQFNTNCEVHTTTNVLMNRKITFNKMLCWNSYQSLGAYNLVGKDIISREQQIDISDKYKDIELTYVDGVWRVSEIYDYTNDYNTNLITKNSCNPFIDITNNTDFSNRNIQTSKKRNIKDSVIHTRFIMENPSEHKLYVEKMVLLYEIHNR